MKVDFYFFNSGDFLHQPQLAVGADSSCTYEVRKLELRVDSELVGDGAFRLAAVSDK